MADASLGASCMEVAFLGRYPSSRNFAPHQSCITTRQSPVDDSMPALGGCMFATIISGRVLFASCRSGLRNLRAKVCSSKSNSQWKLSGVALTAIKEKPGCAMSVLKDTACPAFVILVDSTVITRYVFRLRFLASYSCGFQLNAW